MIYYECTLMTTHEAEPILSEVLLTMGAEGIATEDPYDFDTLTDDGFGIIKPHKEDLYTDNTVTMKAYFPCEESTETLTEEFSKLVHNYDANLAYTLTWSKVNSDDWSLNSSFEPIQLLDYLYAVPEGSSGDPNQLIYIEPGMAFGTGDHPTTKLAIRFLSQCLKSSDIVFDVGTGTGIIAIAAARLGAKQVYAYDLDRTATDVARHHIAMNHLESTITVQENNLLQGITQSAHIIVANIVTPILLKLMNDAYNVLDTTGYFILSGIQQEESDTIHAALTKVGFHIVAEQIEEGWLAIVASKVEQSLPH